MKQGWEIKKLGEVATYVNGFAFKPEHWGETGIPIIRIQNLNNRNADFNYCTTEIPEKFVVEDGDILISWSASLGVYEWNRGRAYLNQHIFKVIFNKVDINKYFLKYAVNVKLNDMLKDVHGATMKHIIKRDFDNTMIPYPSCEEQEKIVAELDCLSGIIEKKKQQLKEYDALAQSIFYEMFGNPIDNEKGWEVKNWSMLFDTILGKMLDKKKQIETDETLPYLGNTNVQWGYFDLQDLKTMTFSNKERDKLRLKLGDILICEGGDAGRCAVWSGSSAEILFQKAIHRARIKRDDEIVPCYISFLLREIKANGGLKNYISKSTIEHLTGEKLNILPIMLPPLTLQQEFASKIEAIEKQKELIKQSIAETETLFNSRMDFYFN